MAITQLQNPLNILCNNAYQTGVMQGKKNWHKMAANMRNLLANDQIKTWPQCLGEVVLPIF